MIWPLIAALALDPPVQNQEVADGPFRALVIAVPNLEQFDREWAVRTEGAQITSTGELVRNKPTLIVVLFGGCRTSEQGKCRIQVRHEVTAPDGKSYGGMDGSKASPPEEVLVSRPDAFFLAPQVMGIRIEPGEALGLYRFKVTISDLNGRRTAVSEQTLRAVEAK